MGRDIMASIAITGMLGVGSAAAQPASPAMDSPIRLTVRLDDGAGVPGPVLKCAKARTNDVFARIGVRVDWIEKQDAERMQLAATYTLVITTKEPTRPNEADRRLPSDLFGYAVPEAVRAYVFYQRIVNNVAPERDVVTLLGDVMAHELGHLMLPRGHSAVGLMQPTINMRSQRVETFSQSESSEIHARLRMRSTE